MKYIHKLWVVSKNSDLSLVEIKKKEYYAKLRLVSNRPASLNGTAKTHIKDTIPAGIKYQPIIDQIGFYTYNTAMLFLISCLLCVKLYYSTTHTQYFPLPFSLTNLPPIEDDEDDSLYEVQSLFTNILVMRQMIILLKKFMNIIIPNPFAAN